LNKPTDVTHHLSDQDRKTTRLNDYS
jgi:hypothetical protein